jgi:hypothetical protein
MPCASRTISGEIDGWSSMRFCSMVGVVSRLYEAGEVFSRLNPWISGSDCLRIPSHHLENEIQNGWRP